MNKKTILIVDDEVLFVQALKNYILEKGEKFNVRTSYDGKEAFEILEKEKIELMILDINMPVLDGVQLLTELHSRNIWLPIIILTNVLVFPDQTGKIFEDFGIKAYMEKPVNLEELEKMIREVLRPSDVDIEQEPDVKTKFDKP
jgi:DNA-binding response OmpR family regulator